MKKFTLDQLRTIAEGAALVLRDANEQYQARRPAYQKDFIPYYLLDAQHNYRKARAAYEAALAESEKRK